jgi:hypothetical protein
MGMAIWATTAITLAIKATRVMAPVLNLPLSCRRPRSPEPLSLLTPIGPCFSTPTDPETAMFVRFYGG